MVHIKLINGEIQISSTENINNEDELLKELNRVLCFTITIYKRRLEKLQQRQITEMDEIILNQKIKESIVMIPVDEIRDFIEETDNNMEF